MELISLKTSLDSIEIEDLEFVERDLSFNELASLAILLYGEERTAAEFALQRLLVISNALNANQEILNVPRDILRMYALNINQSNWRAYIIEALSVINARRVLRKLGFKWETIRRHYLPHITELSLHLHPLLKGLLKICDNLTPAEAGRLIFYVDKHHRPKQDHFRFYNSEVLEVFILDWISRRIISIGNRDTKEANLTVLFEYFKLNELEDMKTILIDTLYHNAIGQNTQAADASINESDIQASPSNHLTAAKPSPYKLQPHFKENMHQREYDKTDEGQNSKYKVNFETAGTVLIINEREFYAETDPELKHLLLDELPGVRKGTDVDKEKLIETFSSLGYKPVVKENLTHIEILDTIGAYAERSLFNDSFVVCILSHGIEGKVIGSNSIPVAFHEIEEKFTTESLKDKPKVLIIQACQESNKEKIKNRVANNDLDIKKERKKRVATNYADILIAYSTVSGFSSIRDTAKGTWFIQSVCEAINRLYRKKHLADILTTVIHDVSTKKGKKDEDVMIPQITSRLRKDFFLPSRK